MEAPGHVPSVPSPKSGTDFTYIAPNSSFKRVNHWCMTGCPQTKILATPGGKEGGLEGGREGTLTSTLWTMKHFEWYISYS